MKAGRRVFRPFQNPRPKRRYEVPSAPSSAQALAAGGSHEPNLAELRGHSKRRKHAQSYPNSCPILSQLQSAIYRHSNRLPAGCAFASVWPPNAHGICAPSRAFQSARQLPVSVSVFSRGRLPAGEVNRASVGSDHMECRAPRTGEHHEHVPTTGRRPRGEAGV